MGYTLITGASRGLGADWAVRAAQHGQALVLVVRRPDDARDTLARVTQAAPSASVRVLSADLAHPAEVESLVSQLADWAQNNDRPDRWVNNAGFGDYAPVHRAQSDVLRAMVEVNVQALMRLSQWALQNLTPGGRLVNIASTAGFQAGPGMAAYYASKAFVLSFTEALADEARPLGISVTAVCPGPTRTHFFDRARLGDSHLVSQGLMPLMDAHDAVAYAFQRAERRKRYAIPGFMNRVGTVFPRLVGRRWAAAVVGWLQRPAVRSAGVPDA